MNVCIFQKAKKAKEYQNIKLYKAKTQNSIENNKNIKEKINISILDNF